MQSVLELGKFCREAENAAPNLGILLLLQPFDQHRIDTLLHRKEISPQNMAAKAVHAE